MCVCVRRRGRKGVSSEYLKKKHVFFYFCCLYFIIFAVFMMSYGAQKSIMFELKCRSLDCTLCVLLVYSMSEYFMPNSENLLNGSFTTLNSNQTRNSA